MGELNLLEVLMLVEKYDLTWVEASTYVSYPAGMVLGSLSGLTASIVMFFRKTIAGKLVVCGRIEAGES